MDKIMNNFYLKMLIRTLKECKVYEKVRRKNNLNKLIIDLKSTEEAFFPHVLPAKLYGKSNINFDNVRKTYLKLILSKYIIDIKELLNNEAVRLKYKITDTNIIDKINIDMLYSFCSELGINRNTLGKLKHKYIYKYE